MSAAAVFRAIKHEGLSPDEKLVLIILANRSDKSGDCWPSHDWIAKACGISRRTVVRCMAALERKECIVRLSRYGKNGKRTTDHIGVFGGSLSATLSYTPVTGWHSIPTTPNGVSRKRRMLAVGLRLVVSK